MESRSVRAAVYAVVWGQRFRLGGALQSAAPHKCIEYEM
jgi:hypothetical protein